MAVWKIQINLHSSNCIGQSDCVFRYVNLCSFSLASMQVTAIINQDLAEQTNIMFVRTARILDMDAGAAGQK